MPNSPTHRPRNVDWKRAAALLYGDWGTSKAYVPGIAFGSRCIQLVLVRARGGSADGVGGNQLYLDLQILSRGRRRVFPPRHRELSGARGREYAFASTATVPRARRSAAG